MHDVNGVALTIVILIFLLVTGIGFWAARWRRGDTMSSLEEWGLGGRGLRDVRDLVPARR